MRALVLALLGATATLACASDASSGTVDLTDPSDPTRKVSTTPDLARLCTTMCQAMIEDYGVPTSERERCIFQCADSFDVVPDPSLALVQCLKDGTLCSGGDISAQCAASAGPSFTHWSIANGLCRGCYAPSRTLQGEAIVTYVDEKGSEARAPSDLSKETVAAFLPLPSGGYARFAGTGRIDGTFTVADAPGCALLVQVGAQFAWFGAGETVLSFSQRIAARGDAKTAATGTVLHVDLGIDPWTAGDVLELFSPSFQNVTNSPFTLLLGIAADPVPVPAAGSARWQADVPWEGAPLLDASRGDLVWITHLRGAATAGGTRYVSIKDVYTSPPLTMIDGATTTMKGDATPATGTRTIDLTMRRSEFAAFAPMLNPRGVTASMATRRDATPIEIVAFPGSSLATRMAGIDLFFVRIGADTSTADLVVDGATFVDPYPSDWERQVSVVWDQFVTYDNGATPVALDQLQVANVPLATALAAPFGPVVGPATDFRIDGHSAFTAGPLSSAEPTISWRAPVLGQAPHYTLHVLELVAGTGEPANVAFFPLQPTTLRIPPGLLHAGGRYVFELTTNTESPHPGFSTVLSEPMTL